MPGRARRRCRNGRRRSFISAGHQLRRIAQRRERRTIGWGNISATRSHTKYTELGGEHVAVRRRRRLVRAAAVAQHPLQRGEEHLLRPQSVSWRLCTANFGLFLPPAAPSPSLPGRFNSVWCQDVRVLLGAACRDLSRERERGKFPQKLDVDF